MTVLITGATGTVGRRVVDELLARGVAVRALSRDPQRAALPPDATVVAGDLADAPAEAFAEVETALVFPASSGADAFVERAVSSGVSRFVALSSLAVSGRAARDVASVSARHHRAVEVAVTSRADDWTVVRPGNFASNLLSWAHPVRAGFPLRVPYPTSSQVLVHEADVARALAIALLDGELGGRVIELTGPESLTRIEQIAAIGSAIGREVPFVEVGPDEFRADVRPYVDDAVIDMLLAYWSDTVAEPEQPLPAPFGLVPTPFARWAEDHRADFGG